MARTLAGRANSCVFVSPNASEGSVSGACDTDCTDVDLQLLSPRGVVLDRDVRIRVWNRKAQDLWGLRQDEVRGQGLLNQDIGLPVERLKAPVRACLEGRSEQEEMVLDARNRRGRPIQVRVTCTPLWGVENQVRGVIVVMEERADGARPTLSAAGAG